MNNMIKEMQTKSSEELTILVFRLKLQLLEFRFKQQAGDFKNTHVVTQVKKTIARALTILKSRNVDVRIGTHGITMYDRKNNKVVPLNDEASKVMNATNKTVNEATSSNDKNAIKQEVKDILNKEDKIVKGVKKDIKQGQIKAKKVTAVRKTQGGGQ